MMKERNIPLGRDTGFPRWVQALLWGCTIAVAVMIFLFSAQSGLKSSTISDWFADLLIPVIDPEFEELPAVEQVTVESFAQKLVRKTAHFAEFALLGFFLRLLTGSYAMRQPTRWAWLAGTLYACTDELHQLFVPERSCLWQDVLLDSCGVLAGVAAAYALLVLLGRRQNKKQAIRSDG